ncbi:MAG: ABC transporter ATP-binding protein [Desulfobacterales bacterium]
MYHIQHLEHRYHRKTVLRIEDLTIEKGTITGLAGPNGSGKTTLLMLLAFMKKPSQGVIQFFGRPETPFSDRVRFKVTLLTQDPYLMRRSVYDNIVYGLKIRKKGDNARKNVYRALSWVGLSPGDFSHRHFSELSGGETQRVALAARLVLEPQILLLDEPTANVDAHSAVLIKKAALRAREEWGTTLVVASHDQQWLHEICDTVLHMHKGRLFAAEQGSIVEGPWRSLKNGMWGKSVDDRQIIIVPPPPDRKAIALLRPNIVSPTDRITEKTESHRFSGTLCRMALSRRTGNISATFTAGDLSLTMHVTSEEASKLNLFPGKDYLLDYRIFDVNWVQ